MWLTKIIFNIFRRWSDKGRLPRSLTDGDSNHCSAFVTNLGSIGLKCGYHHLANFGTNSIFVVIGFKKMTPFVYAGVYPIDSTEYDKLKDSLEKLSLNDSAIEYEMEDSGAL